MLGYGRYALTFPSLKDLLNSLCNKKNPTGEELTPPAADPNPKPLEQKPRDPFEVMNHE